MLGTGLPGLPGLPACIRQPASRQRCMTKRLPWHEGRSGRPQIDFWLYAEQALANPDGQEINL